MHELMSFIGSVGTLIANSGLSISEMFVSMLGGFFKISSWKTIPHTMRVFRYWQKDNGSVVCQGGTN